MKYEFFPPCKEGYSDHRVCLKAIFDTPMERCCFNVFLGVLGHVDLRWSANSCKLSTRCRLAMDFFTGVAELAEWWWFENSRVCLYYFFG